MPRRLRAEVGFSEPVALARGCASGASVLAGWVLYDALVFVAGGCPEKLLPLVPRSLAWIGAGALLGTASARWPLLPWLLALLALVASPHRIASALLPDGISLLLPRILVLLLLALCAARWAATRWRLGALRFGLCAGVLAAFAQAYYQWKGNHVPFGAMTVRGTWLFVALILAQIPAGALPRPGLRALASVLLVLAAVPAVRSRIARVSDEALRADLSPPSRAASERAPDLLLVVLDTVRADHLSCYGYDRPTTPGLDAFAREHATRYTQARSTSPFTLPSHASLLTGLLPAEHGSTHPNAWAQPLDTPHPTLAERLRERGYRTAAIVANTGYLSAFLRMDRGFEHFDSRRGGFIGEYVALAQLMGGDEACIGRSMTADAARITDLALRWLDRPSGGRPFFLLLNYFDVHFPYQQPPGRQGLFAHGPQRKAASPEHFQRELAYDRELHFLDEHVARLLEHLARSEGWQRTAIVVTSDHGESLGDHGFPDHCWSLFDSMVRVPLLVKPPGGRTAATDDAPIHGAEVHDLMLALLGELPPRRDPARRIFGEWYPQRPSAAVVPELVAVHGNLDHDLVAWVEGTVKTIVSSRGVVAAYDLERDPAELAPLLLSPEEIEVALARAQAWWDGHPVQAAARRWSGEHEEQLRALGYVGGGS